MGGAKDRNISGNHKPQTNKQELYAGASRDDAQLGEHGQHLAVNYGQDHHVGQQQGQQEVDEVDDQVAWRGREKE